MKWTIVIFALLTLAACQETKVDPTLEGFFPEDAGEIRKPNQFADASAAAGARADAMLLKQHFDGPRLNSLGEQKLSLMLQDDDAPGPMTVYLNVNEADATSKARQAAVVTFLKDKGLKENQIEVVFGDNPNALSPAAAHLAHLSKTETGDGKGGDGGSKDASSGTTGGGSSGPSDTSVSAK